MFSWEALEGLAVGGGALYASMLARALAAAGHGVCLFTRLGDGQPMDEVVEGVRIRRCPWDRKRSFFDEIDALSSSLAYYYRDMVGREGPFDFIHCHEWFTIRAGLRALDVAPAGFAVSFHSTEWSRTGVWPDSGDSARIAGLERVGIERADAVVSASYFVQRKLEQQFHPPDWKSEVVYHGVDLDVFDRLNMTRREARRRNGLPERIPLVLFAGRFSAQSGADVAARAAGIVADRMRGARCIFMGNGRLEEEVRRGAGEAGIFLRPANRLVPPDVYFAADTVLAPFRRDLNGRAVFPAWAASKPVATLAGTVPSEFIADGVNGWTLADDPEAVAGAMLAALADPDQARWMGRNGRVAVETAFTWKESASRLVAAYGRQKRLAPAGMNH